MPLHTCDAVCTNEQHTRIVRTHEHFTVDLHAHLLTPAVEPLVADYPQKKGEPEMMLRMQGADIHTVAQLLGHKDLRMAARYQHLSPSFLAEAVGRLDAVFGPLRYQDVTAPKMIEAVAAVTC